MSDQTLKLTKSERKAIRRSINRARKFAETGHEKLLILKAGAQAGIAFAIQDEQDEQDKKETP